jgi:two-component system chemotaxis response regulator CheY
MSLNVLIVDDSAVMRSMIVKTLRLAGLAVGEIHEAANGQEGLDVLDGQWVDLVLADINMPVMNGEEMIDRIRSNPAWKDLPVIVISTEGSQTRIESLRRKNTKFVHKPFSPEVLRDVINDMTDVDPGTKLNETLHAVGGQTFESLAFVLLMPEEEDESESEQSKATSNMVGKITFTGPFTGALVLSVSTEAIPMIAANMLGLEDGTGPTPTQQQDAFKELLNVICGNILPQIAGADVVFNVQASEILTDEQIPETYQQQPPAGASQFNLETGRAQLALFVTEGALDQMLLTQTAVKQDR